MSVKSSEVYHVFLYSWKVSARCRTPRCSPVILKSDLDGIYSDCFDALPLAVVPFAANLFPGLASHSLQVDERSDLLGLDGRERLTGSNTKSDPKLTPRTFFTGIQAVSIDAPETAGRGSASAIGVVVAEVVGAVVLLRDPLTERVDKGL